jgi:arsenite methyltransferase
MTDEIARPCPRQHRQAGLENVEFVKGYIEHIPLTDSSVDVVTCNCVINLAGDKRSVVVRYVDTTSAAWPP